MKEMMKAFTATVAAIVVAWLLLFFIIAACAGCSRHTTTPETVTATRDAARERDSVRTVIQLRTDTVHTERYVYVSGDTVRIYDRDSRVRRVEVHDTIRVVTTDTIRTRVPVPYPVETPLTRWQRTKVDYGGYAIVLCAIGICAAVWWLRRRWR